MQLLLGLNLAVPSFYPGRWLILLRVVSAHAGPVGALQIAPQELPQLQQVCQHCCKSLTQGTAAAVAGAVTVTVAGGNAIARP